MPDATLRRVARSLGLAVAISLGSALALAAIASRAHANAPDPRNCIFDDRLVAAPNGAFAYRVTLRDEANQPINGGSAMLDFTSAPGIVICPGFDTDQDGRIPGTSGSNGVVTFMVRAGGMSGGAVTVVVGPFALATVNVVTMDLDGDLDVDTADRNALIALLGTVGPAGDFDGNGIVDAADQAMLENQYGGSCSQLDAAPITWGAVKDIYR